MSKSETLHFTPEILRFSDLKKIYRGGVGEKNFLHKIQNKPLVLKFCVYLQSNNSYINYLIIINL